MVIEDPIVMAVGGALTAGAGYLWVYFQNTIKIKDVKIDYLEAKIDTLTKELIDLSLRVGHLEGQNNTVETLMPVFERIENKIEIVAKKKQSK